MRNRFLWLCLVGAGLIFGFIVGRGWNKPEAGAPATARSDNPAEPAPPANSTSTSSIFKPSSAPATAAAQKTAAPEPASAAVEPPASAPVPAKAGEDPFLPAVDSGVVNSVDAGATFNKMIARPSTADQPNQLGDLHRALEREPRDDGWAYSMEAELQNSMVNDTSMGKFKMEHIECRSTICEVRVSGNGDQADAVRSFGNALPGTNFNQQLFMNVSSTVSGHERIDAIYIFRRPAKH
jgi:hypothetical protein